MLRDFEKSNSFLILAEMLPPIYSKAVLADFHKKLAANDLSINVRQLSPASLKDACLERCRMVFRNEDALPLVAYFGEGRDQNACLQAIARLEIDKFRPLGYFIKGRTQNPDDKVVELVAWLIDFKDRPYDPRKDYSIAPDSPLGLPIEVPIKVDPVELMELDENEERPQPISSASIKYAQTPSTESDKKRKKLKKIIITITIVMAAGMVSYWAWLRKPTLPRIEGQRCMYWVNDHYQPIDCNQKVENAQVIALDTAIFYHFKKINQPDTITFKAIGSVWYARYRGGYEFYTAEWYLPIDPTIRLRPITEGIIRLHVPFPQ